MNDEETLKALWEIRDLLRLIAEPQIAARDQKRRDKLLAVVGRSVPKAKSVSLMNGTFSQADIRKQAGMNQGHLSTMVKELAQNGLLTGDIKQPNLAISIPPNFFDERNG